MKIIKNAFVTRLITRKNNVVGVRFEINGRKLEARSKKEVILSAGVVGTPKILMLSGIGRFADLRKFRIPVVKELEVGCNMQDHVVVPLIYQFNKGTAKPHTVQDVADSYYSYLMHRTGSFSGIGMTDLTLLINTMKPDALYHDVQHQFIGVPRKFIGYRQVVENLGYNDDFIAQLIEANEEAQIVHVLLFLPTPKSRGFVKLRSRNPYDPPIINPRYLSDHRDVETIIRGIKEFIKLEDTESFKNNSVQLLRFNIPECDKFEYKSDDYWECYASYQATTLYHPVGSVRAGLKDDSSAVLDPRLKVYGMNGVRVIDGSIAPKAISANPNGPIVMIAEKASDRIKKEWN